MTWGFGLVGKDIGLLMPKEFKEKLNMNESVKRDLLRYGWPRGVHGSLQYEQLIVNLHSETGLAEFDKISIQSFFFPNSLLKTMSQPKQIPTERKLC